MIEIILFIGIALIPAVVLHEFAHGWVANRLGDPTARLAGRLTLNPVKHMDPIGSIILPGVLLFIHSPFLFGWAKPVPVNFLRLDHPKRDMVLVAIAGPGVNILLAVVLAQLIHSGAFRQWQVALVNALELNLVLAVFNMIPIPPLDGSRVISGFLPNNVALAYNRLEPYGILIVLVAMQFGLLSFIYPIIKVLMSLLRVPL